MGAHEGEDSMIEKPLITRRLVIAVVLSIGMIVLRFFDKVSVGEFSAVIMAIIGFYFRENESDTSVKVHSNKTLNKRLEEE